METIRNYLENMFMNLPNSVEVLRAKEELLQMMEDKYIELKSEGKTENEAIGIVISEFGNLKELAEELKIGEYVKEETIKEKKPLSIDEVNDCLREYKKRALIMALGVVLCICSPVGTMCTDAFGTVLKNTNWLEAMGDIFLFVAVAAAVVLFILAGEITKRWNYLEKEKWNIDFSAVQLINDKKAIENETVLVELIAGIVLCIVSVIPVIISDTVIKIDAVDDLANGLMLIVVAVGVFFIVHSQAKLTGYERLLRLNDPETVGGNFAKSQKS